MNPHIREIREIREIRAIRTSYVVTADGVRLATDLCLPEAPQDARLPAVVIRTPYDRRRHHGELRGWAARGFAAIAQDVRGRHDSGGDWHPYRGEAADGAATLAWIRRQTWSDRRVVAAGASYAAHCALALTAGTQPPDAVIAAVPALGPAETARETTGPERLLARAGWWAAHGDRRDSDEDALAKARAEDPQLLEHLPVLDLPSRLGRALPSWPSLWRHRPDGPAALTAARSRVPLLAVGGTHDPFAEDTLRLWHTWGGPARLLLGPWGHALTAEPGPDAGAAHRLRLGELYVRWATAALAGSAPAKSGAVALGGSELWLGVGELDTRPKEFRFADCGGLRLLRGPEFTADPARPVRSDDLGVPRTGPADRCLLVTAPQPRPLDLIGPAEVRLRATADTAVADWAVRLVALTPEGAARPLATGVVRHRAHPGRAADVPVPLGHLARRLAAGTRLRLEIAGHHFPAHARNPHTGEDPLTATRLLPSARVVDVEGSALLLPVAPPRNFTHAVNPVQEICR
ncbi:CocE/NonD family hydrolase [Streptomyces sp. A3M-1-3]|uniref:CocE/NonD family hydrolase n=1 Tax=Streptomyces sp. A3M-1-3 TaxID=2962044 RepID=UPI0020B64324|nr:CocE/NonD family hydrolase [Streptomyces sp. A3M-1-3]MCP3820638.1 CocE/NonD family hydrolase [Streptomyces sp. A3M-1-3]